MSAVGNVAIQTVRNGWLVWVSGSATPDYVFRTLVELNAFLTALEWRRPNDV